MTMAGRIPTYKGVVYPWHCDQNGHMNVMWYVGKFDEASWHLLLAIGITPDMLRAGNRGMAAVDQQISYKRELVAGDIVEVHSQFVEIREKVIRFAHEMRKSDTGEVAATTVLTVVHLDKETRRACAFPQDVRDTAAGLVQPATK
jgi:acyl-CoA thioester hydrolase